jgi:hypothetical protein
MLSQKISIKLFLCKILKFIFYFKSNKKLDPLQNMDDFVWKPQGYSVKVVIPKSIPHWQFQILCGTRNNVIYGPDKSRKFEYIVPMNAETIATKASLLDSENARKLLICVNTCNAINRLYKKVIWTIPEPTSTYIGTKAKSKMEY